MRIAICFSGELRTACHAALGIQQWIGSLWSSCDFFIHTWDRNTYKVGQPHLCHDVYRVSGQPLEPADCHRYWYRPVTDSELDCIRSFYQPKALVCDRFLSVQEQYHSSLSVSGLDPSLAWQPMYHSYSRSIELMTAWASERGVHYDLVFKLRPDVSYCHQDPGSTLFAKTISGSSLADHILVEQHTLNSRTITSSCFDDIIWWGSLGVMQALACYSQYLSEHSASSVPGFLQTVYPDIQFHCVDNINYAIHRYPVQGLDPRDWTAIYLVNNLLDSYDFHSQLDLLEPCWQARLRQALTRESVLDLYRELYLT